MDHPALKKIKVVIKYTTAGGGRLEFEAAGGQGSHSHKTQEEVPCETTLLASISELVRIASLCGHEDKVRETVEEAVKRVEEWRAKQ